ncbi:MAG: hypothetical protein JWO19_269 [Bryobacterales bacterium]|jgi:hypothetical protein|nr:hypothetical protein [Bryobacterales bacterium]
MFQVFPIFRIGRLHPGDAGVKSSSMDATTIVLPAAITALALIVILFEETRHRRRLRRVASIRKALDRDPVSAG